MRAFWLIQVLTVITSVLGRGLWRDPLESSTGMNGTGYTMEGAGNNRCGQIKAGNRKK